LDFVQSTLTYTGTEGYDYLAYINETLKVKRILLSIQICQTPCKLPSFTFQQRNYNKFD